MGIRRSRRPGSGHRAPQGGRADRAGPPLRARPDGAADRGPDGPARRHGQVPTSLRPGARPGCARCRASGGGAEAMNTPDLETRIRSYYRTCEPEDSARLMLASQVLLDNARRPSARRVLWGSLRLVATLAAAVVLLAVLVLPRLGGHVGGGVVGPVPLTGPTFDLPAALNAQVDEAGLMRSGGMWAVQGSYFLTSTDSGATWRAGTFASPGGFVAVEQVFVLDPDHAWAITSNGMNGGLAAPSGSGQLFVVNRTSNGGRTWQSTTVSGDYRCDSATLLFVDADRGFIMCSIASPPGPNGPVAQS